MCYWLCEDQLCYWVLLSVSVLLSVCRQTNCVSWAVGGVPPCRPHTHSGSTLSTANQPALSVKQTVFWPKIVKNWDNFGHNLVTVWQLSLSVKHSFVTTKSVLWREQNRYIFCGRRGMMWVCQVCSSLSKTFGTQTDDVSNALSMSNLHWLLW